MSKQTDLLNLTDAITVDSSNNVGIGTSNTSASLHVNSGITNLASVFESTDVTTQVSFKDTNQESQILVRDGETRISADVNNENANSALTVRIDNTERMRIDASGRVTMPYQPTMHARLVATTTFSANAIFVPTQVNVNIGNHYSSANGLFTAPVAGVYQLAASFLVRGSSSSTTYLSARPRINGAVTDAYGAIYQSGFSTENNCAGVFQIPLAANDTLGFVLVANGTVDLFGQENFMSIRLLG